MEKELTQFLGFINRFVLLTQSDVDPMTPEIKIIEYNKKETILGFNQKCKGIYFVVEGLFRIYVLKEGNEINVSFMSENDFFTDYESLMTDTNCKCGLEAIEKTRVLFLPYDKLIESYDKSHMLERLGRLMVERAFATYIARNNSKSNRKTEQKYIEFESQNPQMVNRIPLKHLASYFGIAPESLSRIRKSRVQTFS